MDSMATGANLAFPMPGCQSGALGHPTTGAAAGHRDAQQVAPASFVAVEETQFQNAWKLHEKVSSQLWFGCEGSPNASNTRMREMFD